MFQDIDDLRVWNRIILNTAWFIVVLISIAEVMGLLYDYMIGMRGTSSLIYDRFITPTMWLLTIMLATEMIVRWSKKFSDYCIMVTATLIPTVVIIYFSYITTIHNILFLSILVVAFYYERWKVYLSCALNMIVFLLLFNYNDSLRTNLDGHDMIVSLFIFLTCSILSLGTMSRGMNLIDKLKQTMEEQQKLMIRNITMDRMTKIDALTELYNHKTFHEYLDRLIDESERTGLRLHLAMLDIDNFKKINEKFGHQVGDIVLSTLADGLRISVSPHDFVSRYGGEEFAIIFVDQSDEEVLACAEHIRSHVSQMDIIGMGGQAVTISIGLQAYTKGTSKEELFRNADNCLYEAKRTGKNKVVWGNLPIKGDT
ncbi:MAG: GGDEF domain-containing protein [Paenibacillaceae bacterium]